MDRTEIKQIARFLLDCQEALGQWDSPATMMHYLHRLYEVSQRMAAAVPDGNDRDTRFARVVAARKARRLRRMIEEGLGIRN